MKRISKVLVIYFIIASFLSLYAIIGFVTSAAQDNWDNRDVSNAIELIKQNGTKDGPFVEVKTKKGEFSLYIDSREKILVVDGFNLFVNEVTNYSGNVMNCNYISRHTEKDVEAGIEKTKKLLRWFVQTKGGSTENGDTE